MRCRLRYQRVRSIRGANARGLTTSPPPRFLRQLTSSSTRESYRDSNCPSAATGHEVLASSRISGYPFGMSKILVSVDDKLLAKIDRAARSAGLSRSAYLARLAARDLGADRGPGADRQARRAIARLEKLFGALPAKEDATEAVRVERDSR